MKKNKQIAKQNTFTEFLLYTTPGGELHEDSVISILELTADDGKNYSTKFYNLDAIEV
ncbi:MAG: hypothetical protein NTX36_02770 [Proteobacteria bacterium]|nr:hypothetical protein [Pseudomonadota bacterium]